MHANHGLLDRWAVLNLRTTRIAPPATPVKPISHNPPQPTTGPPNTATSPPVARPSCPCPPPPARTTAIPPVSPFPAKNATPTLSPSAGPRASSQITAVAPPPTPIPNRPLAARPAWGSSRQPPPCQNTQPPTTPKPHAPAAPPPARARPERRKNATCKNCERLQNQKNTTTISNGVSAVYGVRSTSHISHNTLQSFKSVT